MPGATTALAAAAGAVAAGATAVAAHRVDDAAVAAYEGPTSEEPVAAQPVRGETPAATAHDEADTGDAPDAPPHGTAPDRPTDQHHVDARNAPPPRKLRIGLTHTCRSWPTRPRTARPSTRCGDGSRPGHVQQLRSRTAPNAADGAAALGVVGASTETAKPGQTAGTEPFGPRSAHPLPDGGPPGPDYTVKDNTDSLLYHTTESRYYVRTRAEAWFADAEAAEVAGFAPWNQRRRAAALQGLASDVPTFTPGPYPALRPTRGGRLGPESGVHDQGKCRLVVVPHADSHSYTKTKAEAWSRTAAHAEAAGFTGYRR